MREFMGYERPNGSVGVRNHVLILPATRVCNLMAHRIHTAVNGTKALITTGEYGRTKKDRDRLVRFMTGLATNPNVAAVVLLGVENGYGYPENQIDQIAPVIKASGKPLVTLITAEEGGMHATIEKGIIEARRLVHEASRNLRRPFPISKLCVGVKCGDSDATSGIAGNPSFGAMADLLVDAGGTLIFSETMEVIGAEHVLAERAVSEKVRRKLLDTVQATERMAASIGEDIRTINPIPENIAAGITTLEEKSLGAIIKTGTRPLQGILDYCQPPASPGVYMMDAWMSSYSLMISMVAAGCQMTFYQLGGQELPEIDPPLSAINPGLVAPMHTITGNPNTYARAEKDMDYSSGEVLYGTKTVEQAGQELLELAIMTASGAVTKGETVNFEDPIEVYFEGPFI